MQPTKIAENILLPDEIGVGMAKIQGTNRQSSRKNQKPKKFHTTQNELRQSEIKKQQNFEVTNPQNSEATKSKSQVIKNLQSN